MRTMLTALLVFGLAVCAASGEEGTAEDVRQGHQLAVLLCANCHVAAPDQPFMPILHPPAPSFESIVQSKDFNVAALEKFITTTHRGLDNPNGMPNPYLMEYQVKQVIAFLLSLRK